MNGFPSVLVILQSPSGKALTRMSWSTTTTSYDLKMEGNVKKNGQFEFFLDMARSIPITGSNKDASTTSQTTSQGTTLPLTDNPLE